MKKPKKNKPQPPAKPGSSPSAAGAPERAGHDTRVAVRDVGGEPTVGRASVPVLLIALLAALVYFGDMYIVDHGGQLDARVHQPFRTVKDLEDLQVKGPVDPAMELGFHVYKVKNICTGCHQDDGNGNASAFVPPLAGSDWVAEKDPARLIRIVLNGLQGPIEVNGKQYGQAAMLAWREALTDEEVAAVLTYVRNSWGNSGPHVSADEVKKIRDETKDRSGYWTADELRKISLKN